MLKKLIKDNSGLTTVEVLALTVAGALIAIIAFAGIRGGITEASKDLGDKIKGSVSSENPEW